jgi:2-phospho-L-lactate guanylyltransferase (CobY/MobA/RfbA family)
VPDDVPDYERRFCRRFGMTLEEGTAFLLTKAVRLTCDVDEAEDLVQDFLVEKLFPDLGRPDS